jgi:hypothetical protein
LLEADAPLRELGQPYTGDNLAARAEQR